MTTPDEQAILTAWNHTPTTGHPGHELADYQHQLNRARLRDEMNREWPGLVTALDTLALRDHTNTTAPTVDLAGYTQTGEPYAECPDCKATVGLRELRLASLIATIAPHPTTTGDPCGATGTWVNVDDTILDGQAGAA